MTFIIFWKVLRKVFKLKAVPRLKYAEPVWTETWEQGQQEQRHHHEKF